jgi:transposase
MKALLTDELWTVVEPLLPKQRRSRKGGRPPVPNRAALRGILFVLQTGIPWEYLPQELGCGSGVTCWRRLRRWQRRGVWKRLHRVLLERLAAAEQIDWRRAAVDSRSLAANRGRTGGTRHRPESDGQGETGLEATSDFGRPGHPARERRDGGQRPRLHAV